MARMIPSNIDPETPVAERRVYERLRDQLGVEHTVFHRFEFLTRNHQDRLVEGEIDFLILFPGGDLLDLEVKAGKIDYDGGHRQWLQNKQPIKRDPFTQGRDNRHALEGFFRRRLHKEPRCTIGYAACFPDEDKEFEILPSGVEPQIVINQQQLPHLDAAVRHAMDAFRGRRRFRLPKRELDEIRRVLMPVFELGFSLSDRLELAERTIFSLTEKQCEFLEQISEVDRALIKGCAGSGKTMLAVKKAREIAMQDGKRVLLLAYNEMIGMNLKAAVTDLDSKITATHYHDFCVRKLQNASRLPPIRRSDQRFWDEELPSRFAELIEESPLKYDAIIVDEGQDFRLEYWVTIEKLLARNACFYIFYDPGQNVRGIEAAFPITGPTLRLMQNCRNTRKICTKIANTCQDMLRRHNLKLSPRDGLPDGDEVIEIVEPNPQRRRRALGKILYDLVVIQGMSADRLVILGGHSMRNTCIATNPRIGNFTITEGSDGAPSTIRYRTYMKFKGCEADAVILLDVDRTEPRWNDEALYTAMSRAKHPLFVLRKNQDASQTRIATG